MRQPTTRSWRVEVSFSPFENKIQRDRAYEIWARLFVESEPSEFIAEEGHRQVRVVSGIALAEDSQRALPDGKAWWLDLLI